MPDGADLLAALAPLDLRSRLEPPEACAAAPGRPLADPAPLFAHVAAGLSAGAGGAEVDPVVGASVAFQSVTGRVATTALLADGRLGRHLAIGFDDLRWWPDRSSSALGLAEVRTGPPIGPRAVLAEVVAEVVEPWVAATLAAPGPTGRIGARLLWGNAATSLLLAARAVGRPDLGDDLTELLPSAAGDLWVLRPEPPGFRRTTCCLIDRAQVPRCDECSLAP